MAKTARPLARLAPAAALLVLTALPAAAQLLCTMPNGVTITKNIGDCPADATLVRKPNGDIVRSAPPKPPAKAPPKATAAAPPPPAAQPAAPSAYDLAQYVCEAFKKVGASECDVDSNVFTTSYINTTLAIAPHQARVTCNDVAATMRQATNAFTARPWEIRIYSPFSGARPIATCAL